MCAIKKNRRCPLSSKQMDNAVLIYYIALPKNGQSTREPWFKKEMIVWDTNKVLYTMTKLRSPTGLSTLTRMAKGVLNALRQRKKLKDGS